jgi:hypothetical protein
VGTWREKLNELLTPGAAATAPSPSRNTRTSLGIEQFLSLLTDAPHPSVLDLGCVWQATVSFFTQAGCKLYTEDIFQALYQARVETRPKAPPLAERFLPAVLKYPEEQFRGILVWDLFDYLPEELVNPLAGRLFDLLEPGGGLLGIFHNRKEGESFTRYRVLDVHTLELLPGSLALPMERVYPNRALLNLFAAFRSTRTFVGRDNLRELYLVK